MIDRLNIIHLPNDPAHPHREEREKSFMGQMGSQGINDFLVWNGIYDPDDTIGAISRSHKMIVKHAKENDLQRVIIAEDDFVFTRVGAWQYFIDSIPNDCDMFLSHVYSGDWDATGKLFGRFSSMTMYCVNQRFYDYFLSVSEREHIDLVMNKAWRYDIRVCLPMVCRQMNGWSDNSKEVKDWSGHERGKPMF